MAAQSGRRRGGSPGGKAIAGAAAAPVEKVYPIEEIATALDHAQRGGRSGKILVAPNSPV